MKTLTVASETHPTGAQAHKSRTTLSRAITLLPRLLEFGVVQVAVQFVSALSGFIVIRLLAKQDYAWFTIANSMFSTMNMLADTGITSSLSSIGGPICHDPADFGQLINTALSIRRKLATISAALGLPLLVTLLFRNHAPLWIMVAMPVLVFAAFWLQISVGILYVVPRLALQTRRLQTLDFVGGASRLATIGIAFLTFLNSITIFSAAIAGLSMQFWLLSKWAPAKADLAAVPNLAFAERIKKFVRKQAPNTIFFALQSQISVWLISVLGSSKSVAEVGALSRLGLLFAIVTAFLNSLVVPRLSRLRDSRSVAFAYWLALGAITAVGGCVVGFVSWFPRAPLWILGRQYSNLGSEILLAVTGSVLNCVAGAAWELNASRGWVVPIYLNFGLTVTLQIILIFTLNVSSIHGVLLMNCLLSLSALAICCIFGGNQMSRLRNLERGSLIEK